ncbi:MAG TPA: DUF3703 domain-containing protein [Burkholderiaceae bacterium]|nr:DUF3703 domain-containing protein [Burkholderiaceae bacterium]
MTDEAAGFSPCTGGLLAGRAEVISLTLQSLQALQSALDPTVEILMSRFARNIRPHVDQELAAARNAEAAGKPGEAFRHLERAHVLGQASTVQHVRAHVHMLLWALRHRQPREFLGQALRIAGAATKTVLWIPVGNTGGANVSPVRSMPVAPDLARIIAAAKAGNGRA